MTLFLALWLLQAPTTPALENDYVRVTRDAAPCASAKEAGCGERVIVALGETELRFRKSQRKMSRGDIAVFKSREAYGPPPGSAWKEKTKQTPPPVQSPPEITPPEKNAVRYNGKRFFVFEERLAVGDTRPRHSHSQRVVMQLNRTRLQQWPDGQPEIFVDIVPDRAAFNPPVIHTAKNVGDTPLRGIVIEFKPERKKAAPQSH